MQNNYLKVYKNIQICMHIYFFNNKVKDKIICYETLIDNPSIIDYEDMVKQIKSHIIILLH